jgi:hypothetical protein
MVDVRSLLTARLIVGRARSKAAVKLALSCRDDSN